MKCPSFLCDTSWVRFPKVIVLSLALACAVSLPAARIGLFVDDYVHVGMLEKLVPFGSPWGLFDFAPGNVEIFTPRITHGPFPWFTLPDLKVTFLRPLSSLLTAMDHAVFGRHFAWWHVHSTLWYLLYVLGWGLILRRTLPGVAGAVALLVFALDAVHSFPVSWLANRNALIATAPVLWGFYAHISWREDGYRPGLPLSLLGYTAGLLGGEAALGVFAYLAAYELFAAPGALSVRIRSLLPAAGMGAVYVLAYKILGYGAYGSGTYLDPLAEPLTYLASAPARVLALLSCQLVAFPVDLAVLMPWLNPVQILVGAVALALFAYLLRRAWPAFDPAQKRALSWMIPGSLLSLAPVVATFPSSRLLLAASLGASAVVSSILVYWWNGRRGSGIPTRLLGIVGWFLVVLHFVVAPVAWVGQSAMMAWAGERIEQVCMAAEMGESNVSGRCYVVFAGPDPMTSIYTPMIRAVRQSAEMTFANEWLVVSQAPFAHRVTRTHPNRVEIEVIGGSMLGTEFERLFRAVRFPLRAGETIALHRAKVTVLELGATGPSKVAVEFDCPLEDSSIWFMAWKEGHLRKTAPPGVGESIILPRERGVM